MTSDSSALMTDPNTKRSKTFAAILAGGTGSRMGSPLPKQFLLYEGRCIIEYTVAAFESSPVIDAYVVVVHPDWVRYMEYLVSCHSWPKCICIVPGGSERYESSLHALQAFSGQPDDSVLLIHDGVRPLVSQSLIKGVVEALSECEAAGTAVSCTDTVWKVREGVVCEVPVRSSLMRAQTPQGFRLGVLREAYRRALQQGPIQATDDCGMVMRYMPEVSIHVVEGDERNIKITYPQDISHLKLLSDNK